MPFMLSYNEIVTGKIIVFNDEPYKVLSHKVFRMQKSKPQNVTKLKSLKSGKVIENSFHQSDKAQEADLEKKAIVFIFKNNDTYMFHEADNPSARFPLEEDIVGGGSPFLKTGEKYEALLFNDEIIGLDIPIKMNLTVTEAAPAVRGNTAQGATKVVTLETGATVTCPLFVNEGDVLEINTETGAYVSRIEKA
jgi:elongation factor P